MRTRIPAFLCLMAGLVAGCGSSASTQVSPAQAGVKAARVLQSEVVTKPALIRQATCVELAEDPTLGGRYLLALATAVASRTRPVIDVEHTAQTTAIQVCLSSHAADTVPWVTVLAATERTVAAETAATPYNLAPIKPVTVSSLKRTG
jgi:hypothetical protein